MGRDRNVRDGFRISYLGSGSWVYVGSPAVSLEELEAATGLEAGGI